MIRTPKLPLLALICLHLPAMAQETSPNLATDGRGTPGGVLRLVLASDLYAMGQSTKDMLSVLNAARLMASVTLADTPRDKTTTGKATTGDAAAQIPANRMTPQQMFDAAASLAAGNDLWMDLVDATRREAGFAQVTTVMATQSTLAPGASDAWSVPFFGTSLAEVAILGDGAANLDLRVTDANANDTCRDFGPADTAYCSFFPAENGVFTIIVQNTGTAANSYVFLTN